MLGVLPVFWGWKEDWLAVGKPPKLLEPLDCPNASKFAKPAFAEFCAVNCKGTKHVNGYGKQTETDVLTELMVMTATKGCVLPCNCFLHESYIWYSTNKSCLWNKLSWLIFTDLYQLMLFPPHTRYYSQLHDSIQYSSP